MYYIDYPEKVINLPYNLSENDLSSNNQKENFILTSKIINEFFLNHELITDEKSSMNVFKNIIIPNFSQMILTENSDLIKAKLIFNFYESLSNLFLQKYNQFFVSLTSLEKKPISSVNQNLDDFQIKSIDQFHEAIYNQISKKDFKEMAFQKHIYQSHSIVKLLSSDQISTDFFVNTFLWSIFNSDLIILLKTYEKILLLKVKDEQKSMNLSVINEKHLLVRQDYYYEQCISDHLTRESIQSYILSPNEKLINPAFPDCCSLASLPNYLFAFDQYVTDENIQKNLLKVNLCRYSVSEENHFKRLEVLNNICKFQLVSVGNDVIFYEKRGNIYLYEPNSNSFIPIKQNYFTKISPPFASDGHFIYSILNSKEIGVFEINKEKCLSLTLIKRIKVNEYKKENLDPLYNDSIFSNKLKNSAIITNGFTFEMVIPEKEINGKIIHFVRVISLITGNHIKDFHFENTLPLYSLSFDPFSRKIWSMTVINKMVTFCQFNYNGPEPQWLSNINIKPILKLPKFSNNSQFFEFMIEYGHSIICSFFGHEFQENEKIPDILISCTNFETIDFILNFLSHQIFDVKLIQILLTLLTFQIKSVKIKDDQVNTLLNILSNLYSQDPFLFDFLSLFIIQITPYLQSKFVSQFFSIIFNNYNSNNFEYLFNLLSRLENTENFPYVLDNNCPSLLYEIISPNSNTETKLNFMLSYQISLFVNYSRIYHNDYNKIHEIEVPILGYSTFIICKAINYIQNLESIESFNQSLFIDLLKKLLIDLRLTADSSIFTWSLLPILLELLKEFPSSKLFNQNENNPFYLLFMNVFSLYTYYFKKMLSFSDINCLKNHFHFINNVELKQEKTISEIFENKLNDDDFQNVMNQIYSKVANPLNKHLTENDKEIEKIIFLSMIFKTQTIEEIVNLHNQIKAQAKKFVIVPEIRKIIQLIYSIRSKLRFERQNGNENEYFKMQKNYSEKAHFLLKFQSEEKFELKELIYFYNNNLQISEIIQEQAKLKSVKINFDMFIQMANSFINQKLPSNLIYLFIMHISNNSDFLSAYELIKSSVMIDLKSVELIIKNLSQKVVEIPLNVIICFICNLLLMLHYSYSPKELHNLFYNTFLEILTQLSNESNKIDKKVCKSSISIISHFNRILFNEKIFAMNQKEKENIIMKIQNIDKSYSMSFSLSHSLFQGFFVLPKTFNHINSILGFVGQPKFHKLTLLLYDYLSENENEEEYSTIIIHIFEIIGTVLSGSNSNDLLQIAVPIEKLNESPENLFIRTSTSQLACVLDLVQIIRRLILKKESKCSSFIINHFEFISNNFQSNDSNYLKQLYAMFFIMSNDMIKIIRPFTFVKTKDNKSYFIVSMQADYFEGLLLPISDNQIVKHKLKMSSIKNSYEPIQYNSCFKVPYSLFKNAIKIEKKQNSDWLYSFYALNCLKENIFDYENDEEFSDFFFSKIKYKRNFKDVDFNQNSSIVLSIIKKSLSSSTTDIFNHSLTKLHLYHTSFTELVFNDDFSLNENEIKTYESPHVFVSSVLSDIIKPVYFCIKYEMINQAFNFGIINHSINSNNSISINYCSKKSGFFVNGEKVCDYDLQLNTFIECAYYPTKNRIYFADSKNKENCLFSCELPNQSKYSFFVLIYPRNTVNYFFGYVPQTYIFKNTFCLNEKEKTSFVVKNDDEKEIEKIISYSNQIKSLQYNSNNEIKEDKIKGFTKPFFTYADFQNIHETNLYMTQYQGAYFTSLSDIYNSPIRLSKYIQIQEFSGQFTFIEEEKIKINENDSIPVFNIQKYYNLPSELINLYVNEACQNHHKEILSLIAVRALINSKRIDLFINRFFHSKSSIIKFITTLLLLLEPIQMSNLNEGKSPIDFTSFNGIENCVKTDLYDYHLSVTKLINFLENNEKEKFIKKWFKKLHKDFNDKYFHFVKRKNKNLMVVKSSINNSYQTFNKEEKDHVLGWIIFPFKFGCYSIPNISINKMNFPRNQTDQVNYAYCENNELRIKSTNNELIPFGILPFSDKSNHSLLHSFYHLIVSLKYFVLFSKDDLTMKMKNKIWKMVFNSIIAGSPFFYSHSESILNFLQKNIQFDFMNDESISILNILNISNSIIKQNQIMKFLNHQNCLQNEFTSKIFVQKLFNSKTTSTTAANELNKLPDAFIPVCFDQQNDIGMISKIVLNVLNSNNSEESPFPIHFIISEWLESFMQYPPCDITYLEPNMLSIKFIAYVPSSFQLFSAEIDNSKDIQVSYSSDFSSCSNYKISNIQMNSQNNKTVYIKFSDLTQISKYRFNVHKYFCLTDCIQARQLIFDYKEFLLNDINEFCHNFSIQDDQQILDAIVNSILYGKNTRIYCHDINRINNNKHRAHLLFLRSIYLYSINYLYLNEKSFVENLYDIEKVDRFIDSKLFSKCFLDLVSLKNGSQYARLRINRQNGLDYRNGINKNIENSMIGQFAIEYLKKPCEFRNCSKPFSVVYLNESGIDVGGLMRDFITEMINDINSQKVGLFIQTPNGRNHEGNYQECIIPVPLPEINNTDKYYRSIGALIGIAIRTKMKQSDLLFPPLFWNYIISGRIKIDDIYDIYKSYKNTISNLIHSKSVMDDKEFESLLNSTTVLSLRGVAISTSSFDFSLNKINCERFINHCNEFIINELLQPLEKIRLGFWENLNIEKPPYATGRLIEYLACGDRTITVDDLRRNTRFVGVSDVQKSYFWDVVSRFNNDERKKLIHFATGLNSMSQNGLLVDFYHSDDDMRLPTASTCFFAIHLPPFSNAENMYNAFKIAINETGTFENA